MRKPFFVKKPPLSYKITFWSAAVAACLWTSGVTLMRFGVDLGPWAAVLALMLFGALLACAFGFTWMATDYWCDNVLTDALNDYFKRRRAARARRQ